MAGSYVVTGSGGGIGRPIAERLLADGCQDVALDRDRAERSRSTTGFAVLARTNGAILPIDGGRSALGLDPEQA
jgi:NAD(P)-dependent dehydrogenase (short-subunit alcohol dehydrogenase family)